MKYSSVPAVLPSFSYSSADIYAKVENISMESIKEK